jgi:phosphoglycerate dehydrogenase-like enzyme
VERVLTPSSRARDLTITNARGVFSRPIAEYVMLMILAVSRRLPSLLELQAERTWQPLESRELRDVTVGIVGLGSLGRAVGALATAFGCRVVATRRRPEAGSHAADGAGDEPYLGSLMLDRVLAPEQLPELLAESDFIVLAAPLTEDTHHLIDDAAIDALKPGAWIINVARGELVDERALSRALREGRLGGAVLDTFREEPLPPTSPLYDLPNVILTPHTSWSSTRVLDRSVDLFCENLRRYRAGQPLVNVVDPNAGY